MSWRNNKTVDASIIRTDTSAATAAYNDNMTVTWAPSSAAQSLMVAKYGQVIFAGTAGITGNGHPIGVLGEVVNAVGQTLALVVGIEGVVKNSHASGVITEADVVVGHMNNNVNTLAKLNIFEVAVSNNTGLISELNGFHFRDLSGLGGTVNNKRCLYNEDTGAALINNGVTYLDQALRVGTYTVAAVPSVSAFNGYWIHTSNGAAGSPIPAFSDGTNWLRFDTNTAIASS